jgi:hypothetical protein
MDGYLDKDDNIIKNELLRYYHFRQDLIAHINKRSDELGQMHTKTNEYDYCTVRGQIIELQNLLAFIKENAQHTIITKQIESANKK